MSFSCSFSDCRRPAYARWLRVAYLLNADEQVNTTFLACEGHDERLNSSDAVGVPSGVLRIGLFEDEACWHREALEKARDEGEERGWHRGFDAARRYPDTRKGAPA